MVQTNGMLVIILYIAVFIGMIASWRFWPASTGYLPIVIIALVLRAMLLPLPPNDDMNRYIWEGQIQNAGCNPYAVAPSSPALASLRSEAWKGVNHKDIPTIYGPLSELLFRGCAAVSRSALFFKIVFMLFDIGVVLMLMLLMRTWSMEPRHLILYAFNPLALYGIAAEGHMESIMLFWLVCACYFLRKERWAPAYLFFGLALSSSPFPLCLLPFLLHRKNTALLPLALVPPVALYALYASPGVSFLTVPLCFATRFHFNGLAATVLALFMPLPAVPLACLLLFAIVGLYIFFFVPDIMRAIMYASGAFFLCSTTSHPWYLLPVTALLPFYRSRPWLVLHLTVAAAIVVSLRYAETGVWKESRLLLIAEYLPFAAAALRSALRGPGQAPAVFRAPAFLSIIIPVINERDNIGPCIDAIEGDPAIGHEIIVVDGGSNDGTPQVVAAAAGRRKDIRSITAELGRGIQIKKGIDASHGDTILILHADTRPDPAVVPRLVHALVNNPHAAGGSFRARYTDAAKRYRFTALCNDLRARLTGISFGDQAQFFRKETVAGELPGYKLMEDIEISLLMKERGAVLHLPEGLEASTRKWKRDGYGRNFLTVTLLTAAYLVRRRLGAVSKDCGDFYRAYYGPKVRGAGQ
jgi:hypothetical protein